jgi:hypothetical protein
VGKGKIGGMEDHAHSLIQVPRVMASQGGCHHKIEFLGVGKRVRMAAGESGRDLEEEFGRDVEAAAEAERGKLETRKQKLEMGKERIGKESGSLALLGMTRKGFLVATR